MSVFTFIIGFLIFQGLQSEFALIRSEVRLNYSLKMTRLEVLASTIIFVSIALGFYAIITINNVGYADFIKFVRNN